MKLAVIAGLLLLGGESLARECEGFDCSRSLRGRQVRPVTCRGWFNQVSARQAFSELNPGWNVGNTLDAIPNEGSWNNAPVIGATFDDIRTAGFKSVRIPVTWTHHMATQSPNWTIDPVFLDRVETVVDMVLQRGFWAILNVHHDSWEWADLRNPGNYPMIEERFSSLWDQIGRRFACKSSKLIFEPINEPAGDTAEQAAELNKLNDIFLQRINTAGGFNPQRVVSLTGLGHDSIKTSQWFERGTLYPQQPWGLQFHYYSPYDFIFGAWGRTVWGSDADKAAMDLDFQLFRNNFTGIPTFIGEWQSSVSHTETAARWKYYDHLIRSCNKYNFSNVIWDNGEDLFNRTARRSYDPAAMDIVLRASRGEVNTLAESTTDQSATTQQTSAYIFHKAGTPIEAKTATYQMNGNTLLSVKNSGGALLRSSEYTMSGGTLTLSASYLSKVIRNNTPGTIDTLTLDFNRGASLTLQIVQYDTPTVAQDTYPVQEWDLRIPIQWAGVNKVAAVRALKADGVPLADDWTVWLGPLQQGRWTFGNWGWDKDNFIVWTSGLNAIRNSGQNVTLTVEFFPRSVGQNSLNITITP